MAFLSPRKAFAKVNRIYSEPASTGIYEMTKVFGGEASLMGQVALLSGQVGYLELHWQRFCASQQLREQIKQLLDGEAEIVPLAPAKPARQPSAKQQIIKFYQEVFGLGKEVRLAMRGQTIGYDPLSLLSASLPILGDDVLTLKVALDKIAAYWPNETAPYVWSDVQEIKIPAGHERPAGAYILRHTGEVNSDDAHKGKSYNDVLEIMKFMVPKEYVILWAYTLWSKRQYLDQNGWTRLCALWADGSIVRAFYNGHQLCLNDGTHHDRYIGDGPREVSFVPIT